MKTIKNYFLISILFFSFIMCFSLFGISVFAQPDNLLTGEGTAENPFLISTEEDLINFKNQINNGVGNQYYYKLENSITLLQDFTPIGTIKNPFMGTFDGNGKTINNVNITQYNYSGLFGVVYGATIKNLGLEINITLNGEGNVTTGAVTAKATNSIISGCYSNINLQASKIVRQEEQYASAFSSKINNSNKTALSGVSSVNLFNLPEGFIDEEIYSVENGYMFFNQPGLWYFSVVRNQREEQYTAFVENLNGNLQTVFYSQTNAPSGISRDSLEVLDTVENAIEIDEQGNMIFNQEGIFRFNIKTQNQEISRYCAVVEEVNNGYNAKIFAESIASVRETFNFETYGYENQIIFGGIVGDSVDSYIQNCYSIPSISILQEIGENSYTSYFGGICGSIVNGEITNVYTAPTNSLISELVSKNGNLSALNFNSAPIKINNSSSLNQIVFGGVAGVAKGSGLKIYNTMFFSLLGTYSPSNLQVGGIVGNLSANNSLWPEIMYAKYLNVSNINNISNFSNGVGNASSVGYSVNSSVSNVNSMPTEQSFNSWNWNEFRAWDFENVWKATSVYPQLGFFFPSLQKFAIVTISVSGENEVAYTPGGNYLRGYYTLEIEGFREKSIQISTGSTVTIIATFYDENGNSLRDFKNYFYFTNWKQNGYSISEILYGQVAQMSLEDYIVTMDELTGQTKITFTASSKTEGSYDVQIKGRPVQINVFMFNSETETPQSDIGVITKIANNKEEKFTSYYFSCFINEYLNGEIITFSADDSESGNFVFANKWVDGNLTTQTLETRTISVQLDNEKTTSSLRFYPKVVLTEEGLVANIYAYFSEYTVDLKVEVGEGGTITFDNEVFEKTFTKKVIIGQEVTITATPNDGMKLVGWYINGNLEDSESLSITINPSVSTEVSAVFEKINTGGGLETWAIVLIVLGGILLIVGIIVTIILIKRRSYKSYKRNFKNFRY